MSEINLLDESEDEVTEINFLNANDDNVFQMIIQSNNRLYFFLLRSASTKRSSLWSLEISSCDEAGLQDEHSIKVSLYEEIEFMELNNVNTTDLMYDNDNTQMCNVFHV